MFKPTLSRHTLMPGINGKRRSILAVAVVAAGILFYLYFGVYKMIFCNQGLIGGDFIKGYFSAANFLNSRPIYDMPGGHNPYYSFPLVTFLFMPFLKLPPLAAKLSWFALCHVFAWISFFIIYRFGSRRNSCVSLAAACAAVLFSMPLYGMLLTGNTVILIFFGLSFVYAGLIYDRKRLIPAAIAFLSAVKICPAVMMGVFARRRDYRSVVSFIVAVAGMCVLSFAVFGLEDNLIYVRQLLSADKFVGALPAISLTFLFKLFWPGVSGWSLVCANLAFLAGLAALWWRVSGAGPGHSGQPGAQVTDLFALTLIMVLVFPASWMMYWGLLIVPFYFIVFSMLEGDSEYEFPAAFLLLFLFMNFWAILYYHFPLSGNFLTMREIDMGKDLYPVLYPLLFSLGFWATLALFGWVLVNYNELVKAVMRVCPADRRATGSAVPVPGEGAR